MQCTAENLSVVWAQVKKLHAAEDHPVTDAMIDALIQACAITGGGLDAAIALVNDGKSVGTFDSTARQAAAVCSMFKWHSEDKRLTFEFAVSLVNEWERTPEDFERMQSAYYVHYGDDPLCVGFWKS